MTQPTTETKPTNGAPAPTITPQASTAIVPTKDDDLAAGEPSRTLSAFSSEDSLKAGVRIARAIASSSLVPKDYQGEANIPNVMIAMELANRIGASVLMVMQSLDIIHGRPSWRAQFLIATVNASGRFTPLRFRWQGTEGTDSWGARAVAKDRSDGEACVGPLITLKLAKDEGWYQKNGSKWKTMPETMICYRAASFWTRLFAPELSLGIQTREEVIDTVGFDSTESAAALGVGNAKDALRELEGQLTKAVAASSTVPAKSSLANTDPCTVCEQPIVGKYVETISEEGVVGARHPSCQPKAAGERQPGEEG